MNRPREYNDKAEVGRILHFVVSNGGVAKCRPAIVVEDNLRKGRSGYVDLQIFTNGENEAFHAHVSKKSVEPNHEVRVVGSWHWPRECGLMKDAT